MQPNIQIPSTKAVISAAASVAATTMLVRSFATDFVPHELRQYILTKFHYLLATFTNEITVVIDEYEGLNKNQLFSAAEIYLGTIFNPSTRIFRASLLEKEKKIHVSMEGNEELRDKFCGFQLKWRMIIKKTQARYVPYPDEYSSTIQTECRYFQLSFHRKYKNKVLDEYLPYIVEKSKSINQEMKTLKLLTLNSGSHGPGGDWQSVNLDHPATFETLAMDTEIKNMVIDDLERFVRRKELYRKVGKAWKRGYLLFGPPGTGKSSLIAAMANYLNFDVYDLELTDIRSNSDLRRLIISTANRSILVVEDIDASIDLSEGALAAPRRPPKPMYPFHYDQGTKVTLSGLLNFIDGLWSSCGDERIIVFTTNHKDKLDPALLRPGRMDVHIHMSYCTPCGFKMLVSTYLGITEHPLIMEVEQMIETTKVTPAEVGEQLLKSDNPEVALRGLIEFLEKKKENEEVKAFQENLEVTEAEVLPKPKEEKDGASRDMKDVKNLEGLKELIEMVQASPANAQELVIKRGKASIALKSLIEILDGKSSVEDIKASKTNLGESTSAQVQESCKEDMKDFAINTETIQQVIVNL